jgi:hypothetical protein
MGILYQYVVVLCCDQCSATSAHITKLSSRAGDVTILVSDLPPNWRYVDHRSTSWGGLGRQIYCSDDCERNGYEKERKQMMGKRNK